MSKSYYFRVRVREQEARYLDKLAGMDLATQELLVEWNEMEQEEWSMAHLPKIPQEEAPPPPVSSGEDLTFELFDAGEIPF